MSVTFAFLHNSFTNRTKFFFCNHKNTPFINCIHLWFIKLRLILNISNAFTEASTSITLFGKSIKSIPTSIKGIFSGGGTVDPVDTQALTNYCTQLKNGVRQTSALSATMVNANQATKAAANQISILNTKRQAGIITDEQYAASLSGIVAAENQVSIGAKAMGMALNLALNVGIMLAINLIITGITKLVNAQKEAKQAAEEQRQQSIENAKATREEVDSLNELISQYSELANKTSLTTSDKESLSGIQDELIDKYGLEADAIDLINGKYDENIGKINERKKALLEEQLNSSLSSANGYYDNYNNNIENKYSISTKAGYLGSPEDISLELNDLVLGVKGVSYEWDKQQSDIKSSIIGGLFNGGSESDYNVFIDQSMTAAEKVEAITEVMNRLKNAGLATSDTYKDLFNSLNADLTHYKEESDNIDSSVSDRANAIFELYTLQDGKDIESITKDNYEEWENGLYDFAEKNAINEADLKKIKQSFYDIFKDNNVLFQTNDTGETEKVYQSLSSAISTAQESLEGYKETSNSLIDSTKTLNDALSEQISDGGLSLDTVKSLQESDYKTALKYDEVLNKYVIDTEKAKEVSKENISSAINSLMAERANLTNSYNAEMKNTTVLAPQSASDALKYNEYKSSQESKRISLTNDYNNAISELDNQLGILYITQDEVAQSTNKYKIYVDEAKSSVEKYSGVFSEMDDNASAINSAWKEQSEDGKLSIDTIQKLIEAGYESALCFDEQTGSCTLLQDVMNGLVNSQLAEKQAEIEVQKVDLTTKYNEAAKAVETYRKSINSASDAQIYYAAIADKDDLKSQLDSLNAVSQAYKGVYDNIWNVDENKSDSKSAEDKAQEIHDAYVSNFEKEKSNLDHQKDMQVISEEDYYNQLLALVEKYYYGKSEYLSEYKEQEKELFDGFKDLEKEALQNQIDMLQDANNEREKAISLEEKKIALENAQKQKIKTYSTETGFTYTQDKNAIEDAQKDYDDELVNQQIDALEKLKDSIDTNTNTAHTNDELTGVLSQVSSVAGADTKELLKPSQMTDSQFVNWMETLDMTKLSSIFNNSSIVPTLPNVMTTMPNVQNITNNNNSIINLTMGDIITKDADSFTKKDFPKALSDGLTDFFTQAELYNINHK